MKADLAKLRALLARADFLAAAPGLGKFVTVERDDLRELLASAEAVERAPVVDFWTAYDEYGITFDGANEAEEVAAAHALLATLNKDQRVRLLAIGEDG